MKLHRILAATDFSAQGDAAVRRAAVLCAQSGAVMHVIHALPRDATLRDVIGTEGAGIDGFRAGAVARLQSLSAELGPRLRAPVQWALASGPAHRVIVEAAADMAPDLVVAGAHGEGAGQGLFLGGTAAKLLVRCAIPVLLVRSMHDAPYRSVLVATDMGPRAQSVLETVQRVTPGATITLMHAFRVPYEARLRWHGTPEATIAAHREQSRQAVLAALGALGASVDPPAATEAVHGHPNTVLLEAAKAHDLIAVGRHSGSAWVENLLGSTPRFLAHFAPRDVIVV